MAITGCQLFQSPRAVTIKNRYTIDWAQVIVPERVRQGGKLLIEPFVAGTNVYATDNLQKVSLYVVKGLSETLVENDHTFVLLGGLDAQKADLVIKGKIVKMSQDRKFCTD